jgi:hypothetical protein
MVAKYHGF